MISISADTDSKKWKDAIVKDKMNWLHLSDLKGTDPGFIKDNNIFAYPTYILTWPGEIIISTPVDIERVKEHVVRLFAKVNEDNKQAAISYFLQFFNASLQSGFQIFVLA
ncbi:MAG: hypothetical protein JWQ40_4520 [Segetibacter sp.]|nr:hypothetical protein [Segetibacter sp.]